MFGTKIVEVNFWYENCRSEFRVNSATSNEINEHFANMSKRHFVISAAEVSGHFGHAEVS